MDTRDIDRAVALMQARLSGFDRAVLAFMRRQTEQEDRAVERARANARRADREAKQRERLGLDAMGGL